MRQQPAHLHRDGDTDSVWPFLGVVVGAAIPERGLRGFENTQKRLTHVLNVSHWR
jgi:hypothetical protein